METAAAGQPLPVAVGPVDAHLAPVPNSSAQAKAVVEGINAHVQVATDQFVASLGHQSASHCPKVRRRRRRLWVTTAD